ncbi:MAG: hypothetical protein ACUZ8H_05070, partial [Candidatus Anammoxibacter sp.]
MIRIEKAIYVLIIFASFLMLQASSSGDNLADQEELAVLASLDGLADEFAMLEEDRSVTIASKMKE